MEKDVTKSAVEIEMQELWQSYLQSCCESGQLHVMVEQLESQTRDLQKKYEVTNAKSKSLLTKYNQKKQNGALHQPPNLATDVSSNEKTPQAMQ